MRKAVTTMAVPFAIALTLAATVLAVLGPNQHGTLRALQATARFSFVLFFLAYTGAAMVSLFGDTFAPLKRHARDLGQAFAAAQSVHLGLVAWLCHIGDVPSRQTFLFFGAAAVAVYLVTFAYRRLPGPVRFAAVNLIAVAFAFDFLHGPFRLNIGYLAAYAPFAILTVAAPCLRAAAAIKSRLITARPSLALK